MRKHHQKQILSVIQTMFKAQEAAAYADCQEAACSCMDFIDEIIGKDSEVVALFEEYCKLVFGVHNGNIEKEVLIKQLNKLKFNVENELNPTNFEFVFFPYKASMWDSLESLYFAAKASPECEAVVVPIPYYKMNSDRTFGEMVYERDLYPDYVQTTDWREYDVESRHPEAIFVHNPYDGANYITSVHPDFYCKRLKEFTDMLVYVPYSTGVNCAKLHCTSSGCIYSHKTILRTKQIRNIFIKEFTELYDDRHGQAEKKFVALGSPKIDKLINTKRENCKLLDRWKNLVNGKKVVLYNTSVAGITTGGEQYLKKLLSTFEVFKNRSDVVLWWRPHPLSVLTYNSRHPQLAEKYKQIVADYKSECSGVFDDTPDLYRAIAWSDAYYGDVSSSLVGLFILADKPTVYQNTEVGIDGEVFTPDETIKRFIESNKGNWEGYNKNRIESSVSWLGEFLDNLNNSQTETYFCAKMANSIRCSEFLDGSSGQKIFEHIKFEVLK
jgi:hypothetical protein